MPCRVTVVLAFAWTPLAAGGGTINMHDSGVLEVRLGFLRIIRGFAGSDRSTLSWFVVMTKTNTTGATEGQAGVPGDGGRGTYAAPSGLDPSGDAGDLEAGVESFKVLTREEAEKLGAASRTPSPLALLGSQLLAGAVVALLAWVLTAQPRMGWSAAYGALSVLVPSAVFVRGLARQKHAAHGGSALAGFFVWEMVKIALTLLMLVAAPRVVNELSWLALLAGFVVTMKAYWAAVWFGLLRRKSVDKL